MDIYQFQSRVKSFVLIAAILSLFGCSRSAPPVWTLGWQPAPTMSEARTGSKAIAVHNHIYVIGGGKGIPGPDTIHRSVEYTKVSADGHFESWENSTPLNTPRMFLATAHANNVVYAVGGEYFPEGQMKLLNSVERAEIRPDGSLGPWIDSAPMNTQRRSPTTVVVGNYLYAIGGYNGTFLQSVERAQIRSDGELGPWTYVPQRLTMPRYIHGGAAVRNRIYALGGHIQESGRGSGAAEWTTVRSNGELAPWNVTSPLNQPRFLAGSAVSEQYIFIVGGHDGVYLDSVEQARFQPDGSLSAWTQTTPLSMPREGSAVAVLQDNIYVMGGSNQGNYLRTAEQAKIGKNGELGYWKTP